MGLEHVSSMDRCVLCKLSFSLFHSQGFPVTRMMCSTLWITQHTFVLLTWTGVNMMHESQVLRSSRQWTDDYSHLWPGGTQQAWPTEWRQMCFPTNGSLSYPLSWNAHTHKKKCTHTRKNPHHLVNWTKQFNITWNWTRTRSLLQNQQTMGTDSAWLMSYV